MQKSERMLKQLEYGLIIDHDTLFLDTIEKMIILADSHRDKLKDSYKEATHMMLTTAMVQSPTKNYAAHLFLPEFSDFINHELESLPMYIREREELMTDFGTQLPVVTAHKQVEWFLAKLPNNRYSFEDFEGKEVMIKDLEMDTIITLIKQLGTVNIIMVPNADMAARIMTEFKDFTVIIPDYWHNSVIIDEYRLFKYQELLDKHELQDNIELLKFDPIARYNELNIAFG